MSRVIEVAMGRAAPDLLLSGGRVLNVYTGRLEEADVAVAAGRIAYVGSLREAKIEPGDETCIIDVTGRVLVPGVYRAPRPSLSAVSSGDADGKGVAPRDDGDDLR